MNSSVETTIILCGGPVNHTSLPMATHQSNAMIPVNGRPVIAWILDDLLVKGISSATVVLREEDHRLLHFLLRVYANRMSLTLAQLQQEGTIVQSLQAGLRQGAGAEPVRVILGDTLIRDTYHADENFVYVRAVEGSRRWCLAVLAGDDRIVDYMDKQENVTGPRLALCGYYHFLNGAHLITCVERSAMNGERELSDVLKRYGALESLYARPVQEWFDFGNIDNLIDSRRRLLQSRFFNTLTINPILNTITKVSEHNDKLRDELDWYLQIPDELKILCPRIVRHQDVNDRLEIVQEYYGYPTLAELYLFADLPADTWTSILHHILRIHQEFCRYPGQLEPAHLRTVYLEKTWDRLAMLCEQDASWNALLHQPTLLFNGRCLRNIFTLREAIEAKCAALSADAPIGILHGDFCFSNILFDINSQIIRLIDPRGSFGEKGIYGDTRYDIAKLRHSISGLYDYILADMFALEETEEGFTGTVYIGSSPRIIGGVFDRMITEIGYDLNAIRYIEGLLFISMLPLHHGHPQRQKLMFLTGLTLLNEVFSCESP